MHWQVICSLSARRWLVLGLLFFLEHFPRALLCCSLDLLFKLPPSQWKIFSLMHIVINFSLLSLSLSLYITIYIYIFLYIYCKSGICNSLFFRTRLSAKTFGTHPKVSKMSKSTTYYAVGEDRDPSKRSRPWHNTD